MLSILVTVSRHHRQRLMSADALHSWQINARLNQMRDRGMPQGVSSDFTRIQSRCGHDALKRLDNFHGMPAGAVCWKQPYLIRRAHCQHFPQVIRQFTRDRLITRTGFGLRDVNDPPR